MYSVASVAFTAAPVLLQRTGRFFSVTCTIDPALSAGTYYILILDATAAPANTTDTTPVLLHALPIIHASGAAETFSIVAAEIGATNLTGWRCVNGCVAMLSTTVPTNITTAGAHLWCNANVE